MGVKEKTGEVIDTAGEVIGQHKGVWFYTVGQRHGFEVNVKTANTPALYIIDKDVTKNRLVVGTREEGFKDKFGVGEVHWISPMSNELKVRIRHGGELIKAECQMLNNKCEIRLDQPVFGVAPGQAAVFYEGQACLGGGIIVDKNTQE
jgi:tRNA-specific 2-thiouridylase